MTIAEAKAICESLTSEQRKASFAVAFLILADNYEAAGDTEMAEATRKVVEDALNE